jgi:hypothetical protein
MATVDVATYLIFLATVVVCAVKIVLLVRVRRAITEPRSLLGIETDNNLTWCVTIVLAGGVLVSRVVGYLPGVYSGRFGILGIMLLGATVGLWRLLVWLLFDQGAARTPLTDRLGLEEEITRLRLALDRYSAAVEAQDRREAAP